MSQVVSFPRLLKTRVRPSRLKSVATFVSSDLRSGVSAACPPTAFSKRSVAHRVHDAPSVGRPEGSERSVGPEREPRADAALEVADPDVGLRAPRIGQVEGEPVAARREGRVVGVARVADDLALLAGAVHPEQPVPTLARPVRERPVARDREEGEPDVVRSDVLGERNRLARRLQGLRVERLGDERPVPHEEEVAGRRVGHERLRGREELRLRRVERPDPVRAVLRLLPDRHVEVVLPVREELGPADLALLPRRVGLGRDGGSPPGGRDAVDGLVARAVEEDDALRTPGAVGASGRVADLLRRAARDLDLLELPLGEESEEPAVRRPERPRGVLGAGEGLRREGVERPDPDAALAARVGRVERERPAVRREAWRVDRRDSLRVRDLEPDELRAGGRAAHEADAEGRSRDDAATAARPHARRSRLFRRWATGAGSPTCEPPSAIHWSCSFTSCAVWRRSSGSFERQVATRRSRAGGVIGATDEAGGGLSFRIEPIRLAWLFPSKAFLPVAIS